MPNPAKPDPSDQAQSSTFASRRAEAEAREAAGEKPPERTKPMGFRAGYTAEQPLLVVSQVRE